MKPQSKEVQEVDVKHGSVWSMFLMLTGPVGMGLLSSEKVHVQP